MKVYRFSEIHAAAVADGSKRRTLRPESRACSPGDALRLTGPRGSPRTLRKATCTAVTPVALRVGDAGELAAAEVNGSAVLDLDAFARADGFADAKGMGEYFLGLYGPGLYRLVMIEW